MLDLNFALLIFAIVTMFIIAVIFGASRIQREVIGLMRRLFDVKKGDSDT